MKQILIKSWNSNRHFICFQVSGKTLTLLPGVYESKDEFKKVHYGNYVFQSLEDWLLERVK